jgi:PKD repeat protein
MKKNINHLVYLLLLMVVLPLSGLRAQYNGGSADGHAIDTLRLTTCSTPAQFFAYFGGTSDGYDVNGLALTTCTSPPQFFAYFGGTADGHALDTLRLTICASPPQFYAYFGGTADGHATDTLHNTTCATPSQFYAYFGGRADGYSVDTLRQCPNQPPVAGFTVSRLTICSGDTVQYRDTSSNSPFVYKWYFTGGTLTNSDSIANPIVRYNTAGVYSAKLVVRNYIGSDSITKVSYITVNAIPSVNLGNDTSVCQPNTVPLNAANPGASYLWTTAATSQTISATTTGIYGVRVTRNGCSKSDSITVTVNTVPVVHLGNDTAICAGNTVSLNAGNNPATYLWSTTATSQSISASISGSYSVAVTKNGCTGRDTLVLTVNPLPVVNLGNDTSICAPNTVTIDAGNTGATYAWSNSATTQTISASTSANYGVTVTRNGCSASSNRLVTINPIVTPLVSVSATQTTICTGTSISFTATPTNGGVMPFYQWYKDGLLQSGNTNIYTTSSLSNNDSVWCIMTSNATCASPTTATSNHIRMTVTSYVTPTILVTSAPNSICSGDSVTLTASITNGGSAPAYQWKRNGVNVGANIATYGTRTLASADSIWCVLTSNAPCATSITVMSNKVRVTVNAVVTPTISVSATQTTICIGSSVTFTATITNGGGNPTYQWHKNGTLVSTAGSSYTDNTLANNDSVWCVLTSSNACASPSSVSSTHIIITITSIVVPSVSVTASQSTVCVGTSVTFTAHPTNGGSNPTYQWYKDGIFQAGNTGTFTPSSVSNNDSVWCIMTSNAACVSPATVTSAHVYMTVNPSVVPTISVIGSPTTICAGDSVTFTASITNGGANPTYQWVKNGANVGINSATYGTRTLTSIDSVWCVLTSNAPCPTTPIVTSNKVRVTVNPIVTPGVSVSATQTTICTGTSVTFTATPSNGGTSPTYQWHKNGTLVSTAGSSYTDNTLANNDSVWCVLTSSNACASPSSVSSTHIIITITSIVVASVSVTASQSTVCTGTSVTFTAHPTNGGSNPTYQWYKDGIFQAGNTGTFTPSSVSNNDSVWCIMTSNASCVSPATVTSAKVHMSIIQPSYYAYSASVCRGSSYLFNGRSLTQAGIYIDTLTATSTCDSIVTLTLSIRSIPTVAIHDTICYGHSVIFHSQVLTASGTYADTMTGSNGCDSINILYLTVSPLITSSYSSYACQGHPYIFYGRALTLGGTYSDTLSSIRGCDSIVYLTLTIRQASSDSITDTICQGNVFVFHGRSLTQSGVYYDTLAAVNTCDSVIILNLVMIPKPLPVPTLQGIDSLHTTTAFASYQWLRNNIAIPAAIGQTYIAAQNGSYSVIVSNAFGCSDTSASVIVTHVGIDDVPGANTLVFPNPTEGLLHIEADNIPVNTTLELINSIGQKIYQRTIDAGSIRGEIDLSPYASGLYVLIFKDNERIYLKRRIIRN